MRIAIVTALTFTFVFGAAAQQPPAAAQAALKLFASAADVQALAEKAKQNRKKDQPNFSQPIVGSGPFRANLESRVAAAPPSVHEKEAEFFYVVEGSGTLVTGGKLTNPTRNGDNLSGTAVEGGTPREVAKGDFIMVPEGTPHWFNKVNGTLLLMSLHLPLGK